MKLGKRIFDLVCTIPGTVILLPLLLVIGLCIWLDDHGSVFFCQQRIGRHGKPFRIIKFRTMVVDAEKLGLPLTVGRDPRITRVGARLRQSKLDELPQLFNVIVGEMSLVGPRPEAPRYVHRYTPAQHAVLEVAPGITDPASIRYRHESEVLASAADPERVYLDDIMPEKIRLNLDYAQHANLLTDLAVILRTLKKLTEKAS